MSRTERYKACAKIAQNQSAASIAESKEMAEKLKLMKELM